MLQSHKNCQIEKCRICLKEHLAVGDKLDILTGNDKVDHLGKFHSWLKRNGYNPETEFGWGTEYYFDDDLLSKYANDFINGEMK